MELIDNLIESEVDIEQDVYIFMCSNLRDKRKSCGTYNTDALYEYFRQAINRSRERFKKGRLVRINKTGCLSRCASGPNLVIFPHNIWYTYKNSDDIDQILEQHLIKGQLVHNLMGQTDSLQYLLSTPCPRVEECQSLRAVA